MTEHTTFDPSRYLTKVGSADYLEVKWRLVWLRELHPDATLETELISHADQTAYFKATVSIPGAGSASGHGCESLNDFREYFEKAETKAVGRALAALGFGTQFCQDFDFAGGSGAVVDSPIDFASTRGRRMRDSERQQPTMQSATPRQLKYIEVIAREQGLDEGQLNAEVEQLYGRPIAQLDRRDASAFIERLQSRRVDQSTGELPARSHTEGKNIIPESEDGDIAWTEFWRKANELGLSDKATAEKAIGNLGVDPSYALERLAAWAHDNARQPSLA